MWSATSMPAMVALVVVVPVVMNIATLAESSPVQANPDIDTLRIVRESEDSWVSMGHSLKKRETITMISTAPTKRSDPSSSATTTSSGVMEMTGAPHEGNSEQEGNGGGKDGLSTPQLAGIIAGGFVTFSVAVTLLAVCLLRRRKAAVAEKDRRRTLGDKNTRSLEFLTMSLEASSNPWNFSPVDTTTTHSKKSSSTALPPQLPPFRTETSSKPRSSIGSEMHMSKTIGAPIVPALTLSTVVEHTDLPVRPPPVAHPTRERKSSLSNAVRKMSVTFASIVTPNSNQAGDRDHSDHSDLNGTFGPRNTPSPWGWGSSVNGLDPVTPVDYLGRHGYGGLDIDIDIDPLTKEISVADDLVGVAITDRDRRTLELGTLAVATSGIPPPRNPPPTSALPSLPPPIFDTTPKPRRRPLPTMTIPVPSATATATANLATFTLLHQSLCRASTVYSDASPGPGPVDSPASTTRYTYCEGMTPTSPCSQHCATNHSSCVWSCPGSACETPMSSRHTMCLYSTPTTPHRGMPSTSSSSAYFGGSSSCDSPPPMPTTTTSGPFFVLPKTSRRRPGPLKLSSGSRKKKNRQQDLLAGEMAELPPSPRRLPEEIERVTREMRERQQEEVLRRLYGDAPGASTAPASTTYDTAGSTTEGGSGGRARSGSVATVASRKGSVGFGVYGGNWPERI